MGKVIALVNSFHKNKGLEEKIAVLGHDARDEACASFWSEQSPPPPSSSPSLPAWLRECIYTSFLPGGKRIKLLKILLDNRCRLSCRYCGLRARSETERCRLEPEELARLFLSLYRRKAVEGFFLSSALNDTPDRVQARLVKTAEILRRRYQWSGYLHLKIMPGASREAVAASCLLADRVSVNLEAPGPARLKRIAPGKDFQRAVLMPLRWAAEEAKTKGKVSAGITTQFVVGAAGESDHEILAYSDYLYRQIGLRRAYYSPFRATVGTPLENLPPPPPERAIRLYQADWLLREYGFELGELPFEPAGSLPGRIDPKLAWARLHPDLFPVEINRAELKDLLRIPGIGSCSARRILLLRRRRKITSLEEMKRLGAPVNRARDFITLNGKFFPSSSSGGQGGQILLDL